MNGGSGNHGIIGHNIYSFLRQRLLGSAFRLVAQSMGVTTTSGAVRYPDVFVTTAPLDGKARLIGDPVIVFEVLSPTSVRTDCLTKMREYAAVPSIRRYVLVESEWPGIEVLSRDPGQQAWTATPLEPGDTLALPEIGADLTVAEIHEGTSHASPPQHSDDPAPA